MSNLARASLEKLRPDYEDFLRHRGLPVWEKHDPRLADLIDQRCDSVDEIAQWVRNFHERCGSNGQKGQSAPSIKSTQSTLSTYSEIAESSTSLVNLPSSFGFLDDNPDTAQEFSRFCRIWESFVKLTQNGPPLHFHF